MQEHLRGLSSWCSLNVRATRRCELSLRRFSQTARQSGHCSSARGADYADNDVLSPTIIPLLRIRFPARILRIVWHSCEFLSLHARQRIGPIEPRLPRQPRCPVGWVKAGTRRRCRVQTWNPLPHHALWRPWPLILIQGQGIYAFVAFPENVQEFYRSIFFALSYLIHILSNSID